MNHVAFDRRLKGDPISSVSWGRLQRHLLRCTYTTGNATHFAIAQRVALPAVTQRPPFGWLSFILVRLPCFYIYIQKYSF